MYTTPNNCKKPKTRLYSNGISVPPKACRESVLDYAPGSSVRVGPKLQLDFEVISVQHEEKKVELEKESVGVETRNSMQLQPPTAPSTYRTQCTASEATTARQLFKNVDALRAQLQQCRDTILHQSELMNQLLSSVPLKFKQSPIVQALTTKVRENNPIPQIENIIRDLEEEESPFPRSCRDLVKESLELRDSYAGKDIAVFDDTMKRLIDEIRKQEERIEELTADLIQKRQESALLEKQLRETCSQLSRENEQLRLKLKTPNETEIIPTIHAIQNEEELIEAINKLSLIILGKYSEKLLNEKEVALVRALYGETIMNRVNTYSVALDEIQKENKELLTILDEKHKILLEVMGEYHKELKELEARKSDENYQKINDIQAKMKLYDKIHRQAYEEHSAKCGLVLEKMQKELGICQKQIDTPLP